MSFSLALVLSLVALPHGGVQPDSIRSDADIRSAVLRHAPAVRRCYEVEGLGRNPALAGSVEIMVTILPTGAVTDGNTNTSARRKWRDALPASRGAGSSTAGRTSWRR